VTTKHIVRLGDESFTVEIADDGEVRVGGLEAAWRVTRERDGVYLVTAGESRERVTVAVDGDRVQAFVAGEVYDLQVEDEARARRTPSRSHVESLTVPMPARVVKVLVADGQVVKRGDLVVKLEAMKMELPLKAPRDGTVRMIACREGDLVQPGATLLEIA
jgi:biotin carboxyl carrier protein